MKPNCADLVNLGWLICFGRFKGVITALVEFKSCRQVVVEAEIATSQRMATAKILEKRLTEKQRNSKLAHRAEQVTSYWLRQYNLDSQVETGIIDFIIKFHRFLLGKPPPPPRPPLTLLPSLPPLPNKQTINSPRLRSRPTTARPLPTFYSLATPHPTRHQQPKQTKTTNHSSPSIISTLTKSPSS